MSDFEIDTVGRIIDLVRVYGDRCATGDTESADEQLDLIRATLNRPF